MPAALRAFVCGLLLAGCGLPFDPESTLDRTTGGTMKVGITHAPPWAQTGDGEPSGIEVELVRRFAGSIDADIDWVEGETEELASALHQREIDLLIGGFSATSTLASEVTLTHPYVTTQVVVGAPPLSQDDDIAGRDVFVEDGTEAAGVLEKTDANVSRVDDITSVEGYIATDNFLLDDLRLRDTGLRLLETDHVMATPSGENAWITRLERFLLDNEALIDRLLEDVEP